MRLVVDTSIWVKAYAPREEQHAAARAFVEEVLAGQHEVVLPCPVLTEVVCALARAVRSMGGTSMYDPGLPERLGNHMLRNPRIMWLAVDREFARTAASYGRILGLKCMDALIAYTAFLSRCDLLSADRDHLAMMGTIQEYRRFAHEPQRAGSGTEREATLLPATPAQDFERYVRHALATTVLGLADVSR